MKIKLNSEISIGLEDLLETKLLIQANSGSGKSWLIRRILEQSHGKVQQIVIDLEGEFSSLRERFDYILAGKGGDTPADPRSAELLARKLLELNVSAIIDLYELTHLDRKRFVKLFLEAMINAPKELWHPVMVVIDEAHVFCPEKGESEAASAVIELASRGRKRGFCAVLATQRLSKLHKDAAAECNNKLIGRTGLDVDMKRAADELGFSGKGEDYLSLRQLESGEFYAFGPAISRKVIKLPIGDVQTTHPKAGSRFKFVPPAPTEKIKKLLPQLSDLPAEAKKQAQTVEELKFELRSLLAHRCPKQTDEGEIKRAVNEAVKKVERELTGRVEFYKKFYTKVGSLILEFDSEPKISGHIGPEKIYFNQGKSAAIPSIGQKKDLISPEHAVTPEGLTGPEQKVLNALAWCESIGMMKAPQELAAFLSGYKHFRSTGYTNPRGYLKIKGLIDYSSGFISLTDAGRNLADAPDKPLTQEELHRVVMEKLDGPEKKLLQPLLEKYPELISNAELCQIAGYMHERSTGYTNPRGRLKSFGLIEYSSQGVKAREILFL